MGSKVAILTYKVCSWCPDKDMKHPLYKIYKWFFGKWRSLRGLQDNILDYIFIFYSFWGYTLFSFYLNMTSTLGKIDTHVTSRRSTSDLSSELKIQIPSIASFIYQNIVFGGWEWHQFFISIFGGHLEWPLTSDQMSNFILYFCIMHIKM